MSNSTNYKDLTGEWSSVEDIGVRLAIARGALKIGAMAVYAHDNCMETISEEVDDFTFVLDYFLEGLEIKCTEICDILRAKNKAAQEGVA